LSNISSRHRAIFVSVVMGFGQCYAWRKHFLYEKSWRHQCWSHHVSRASEIIWGLEEASLRFWRHIIHLSSTASLRGPKMIVLELRNCFSLLSYFRSSRDILNLPSCEGFILPKPFWSQKSNLPILQPNALNNQMNFGVLHWLHQVPLVVKWYVNFDYFKILSDDPSHILASRRTDCLPHTYWIHSERHWSVELQNHNGKLVIITA